MKRTEELDGAGSGTPCPSCGSTLTRIVYGLPGPELQERAARGEVLLGGCLVHPGNPDWACEECGERWMDEGLPGKH